MMQESILDLAPSQLLQPSFEQVLNLNKRSLPASLFQQVDELVGFEGFTHKPVGPLHHEVYRVGQIFLIGDKNRDCREPMFLYFVQDGSYYPAG